MFLDVLRRRNPAFLDAVVVLHQEGRIPANAYALDLDTVRGNARVLREEAESEAKGRLVVSALPKKSAEAGP